LKHGNARTLTPVANRHKEAPMRRMPRSSILPLAALLALLAAPAVHAADRNAAPPPQRLAQAASTAERNCTPGRESFLQRRVLEKAEQGPAALRQYIFITRSLYGLNMDESMAFVERVHAEQAACRRGTTG
jgi:hypothetical protein